VNCTVYNKIRLVLKRKIGVLKHSQHRVETVSPSRTGGTSEPLSPNHPDQETVDEQQASNDVGGDKPGYTETEDASIDGSSIAHCEVERKRKKKIATSIIQLAELLQLKEVDPTKLVSAYYLILELFEKF